MPDVPDDNVTIPDFTLPDVDDLVWFRTLSFDDPGIQARTAARPPPLAATYADRPLPAAD